MASTVRRGRQPHVFYIPHSKLTGSCGADEIRRVADTHLRRQQPLVFNPIPVEFDPKLHRQRVQQIREQGSLNTKDTFLYPGNTPGDDGLPAGAFRDIRQDQQSGQYVAHDELDARDFVYGGDRDMLGELVTASTPGDYVIVYKGKDLRVYEDDVESGNLYRFRNPKKRGAAVAGIVVFVTDEQHGQILADKAPDN